MTERLGMRSVIIAADLSRPVIRAVPSVVGAPKSYGIRMGSVEYLPDVVGRCQCVYSFLGMTSRDKWVRTLCV